MLLPLMILATLAQDSPAPPAASAPPAAAEAPAAAPAGSASAAIDAGLHAYRQRRFTQAEVEFRRATEADPNDAAAAWYLAYTVYKEAEPKRPNDPGKQRAAEMFGKAYQLDPKFTPDWRPKSGPVAPARARHKRRAKAAVEPAATTAPAAKPSPQP